MKMGDSEISRQEVSMDALLRVYTLLLVVDI